MKILHILEKYPEIKQIVDKEIEKRFPGERYVLRCYDKYTEFVSKTKNLFEGEIFFRRTETKVYMSIRSNYSNKSVPVFWNELEFVPEGFKKHENIEDIQIFFTKEQILEYSPFWSEKKLI